MNVVKFSHRQHRPGVCTMRKLLESDKKESTDADDVDKAEQTARACLTLIVESDLFRHKGDS